MPFNWIIEAHAKAYLANRAAYQWRDLIVRFREAENEIARQEYMHTLSEQTKQENRKAEKDFFLFLIPVHAPFLKMKFGRRPLY